MTIPIIVPKTDNNGNIVPIEIPPFPEITEMATIMQQVSESLSAVADNPTTYAVSGNFDTGGGGAIGLPDMFNGVFDPIFDATWLQIQDYISALPPDVIAPPFDTTPVASPEITDPPVPGEITVSDFAGTVPVMDLGTSPEWSETQPPSKPEIVPPVPATKPNLVWPDLPSLGDVALPEPTAIEIPAFTETFVDEDLILPSNAFNFSEPGYSSALKDIITASLLTEIQTGSYGLNPSDELLLWQRAREREDANAQKAIDEVKRQYSMSGFPIPVGAVTKQMEKAAYEALAKGSSINRDITLKRADLYWEGKKFVFTQGIALEQLTMNLYNMMMDRLLAAAKAEMEILIAYFNAQVARYNARLQKYRVMADVFEVRVKAEIAKVEIFKAQIEAAKLQGDLQKNQVELYKARVEGVKIIVEAYKVDVEANDALMNIERTKMEVFRAEVEAYASQVAAQKYRFDAYESRIKGEVAKMQGYEAEARAYAATVEGKKAQVEVARLSLQSYTERMNALISRYKIAAEEKKNIREAQRDVLVADVEVYKADLAGFGAKVNAAIQGGQLAISTMENSVRTTLAILEKNTAIARIALEAVVEAGKINAQIAVATAECNARVFAAEISTRNLNVSLGTSISKQQSESRSSSIGQTVDASYHVAFNEQLTNFHNYQE